jgi:hypothetical protein
MSVTNMEGERVYCPLMDEPEEGVPRQGSRPKPRQLLSQPILGLLGDVERESFQRAVRETERDAAAMDRKEVHVSLWQGEGKLTAIFPR